MKLTQYTIERRFKARPERVFRAFTEPGELAAWVWGDSAKGVRAEIDLQINGTVTVQIDAGDGWRSAMRGVYLVIVPGHKLIHTVHWDADVGYNRGDKQPMDEIVVVDCMPDDQGCLLKYLHMGIPDDGMSAPEHERSVRATLGFLDKHLLAHP
jgi:uncharacterized protein YndB with AHSA1/START domain